MLFSEAGTRIAAREAELIAQLAGGTIEQPMKELCRRYEKDLYRFGVHFLSREELAEILVQETFRRLCRGAGQYNPRRATSQRLLVRHGPCRGPRPAGAAAGRDHARRH